MSGIYKILNKITDDFYIGSSVDLNKRFKEHTRHLNTNRHSNIFLQRSYNKYGSNSLQFVVLLYCEPQELLRYEQWFIDNLCPTYNICKIAGNTLGRPNSERQKQVVSLLKLGKPRAESVKLKISQTLTGRKRPKEVLDKISAKRKGVPWSESRRLAEKARKSKQLL